MLMLKKPFGLICEFLREPNLTHIKTTKPKFGWSVPTGEMQRGYQIIVASDREILEEEEEGRGNLWDSGKVHSHDSINIKYCGKQLEEHKKYYWRVRFWNLEDVVSEWSDIQEFIIGNIDTRDKSEVSVYNLEISEIEPVIAIKRDDGSLFYDFGKAAFGRVAFEANAKRNGHIIEVHLGEALSESGRLERRPKGTIRYRKARIELNKGIRKYEIHITPDERNTSNEHAILMPEYIGEVLPFRYCEIEGVGDDVSILNIRQLAVHYHFDDTASKFECSNDILNKVWDLCKYSIKATSFCGIYVDGDRERIPYEADAYINQLCHYCVDREYSLARYSYEYLIKHPTWPTEWIMTSVLMAWADYMYTGDASYLEKYYEDLKAKTLIALARDDGLISTKTGLVNREVLESIYASFDADEFNDLVDWPDKEFSSDGVGERDNYDMADINTVVNAYHYRSLVLMSSIANVLSKHEDAEYFADRSKLVYDSFNRVFFDKQKKLYVDGENSSHSSLHANMFSLAFGLVKDEYVKSIADYLESRGMVCSVYGAQYLLEALYLAGRDKYALKLMSSTNQRSWYNMLRVGSTITLEAWDWKYKNNLDWNHAWGAAPANIIPRFLAGIQPMTAGFEKILVKPQPGELEFFKIVTPTIRGTVKLEVRISSESASIRLEVPGNSIAMLDLTGIFDNVKTININGANVANEIVRTQNTIKLCSGEYEIQAIGIRKN